MSYLRQLNASRPQGTAPVASTTNFATPMGSFCVSDNQPVTTDAGQATDQTAATSPETAAADPVAEWLASASPDEIAKNPRVAGILGSRLQLEREKIRREFGEEQERAAREKAQQELDELAQNDIVEFSRRYLTKREQERIAADLANLKTSTRTEFTQQLGRSYQRLPELKDLTPTETETLHRAIAGKSEDEFLESFNLAMVDIAAERRATAKVAKFRDTELAKEREAHPSGRGRQAHQGERATRIDAQRGPADGPRLAGSAAGARV